MNTATKKNMMPVTILTGFLGAGKTTLLKRILSEFHGRRIAVIENEFGPENIDNELLIQDSDEEIIELSNGCVCCTVRGDLMRTLNDLRTRREAGELQFERVIIETTGMANPGPVCQTFFMDDDIAEYYRLDAVITVVDAKHGMVTLDKQEESQRQIGFADKILISKKDLVNEADYEALRARIMRINPRVTISPVHFGEADISELLDISGFNLNAVLDIDPEFLNETPSRNTTTVTTSMSMMNRVVPGAHTTITIITLLTMMKSGRLYFALSAHSIPNDLRTSLVV